MKIWLPTFVLVFVNLSSFSLHSAEDSSVPFVEGSLLGQLGNRMFEIAAASALAWDHGAQACFPDLSPVSQDYRHMFFRCQIDKPKTGIEFEYGGPVFGYEPIPYHPNMRLGGYLQNEKYFAHHRDKIVALFAPHPQDLKYIQKKYGKLLSHPKTVSVHLRYYQAEKPDDDAFIQYDIEYYEAAMALFPEDSLFIVTSDNIDFAKQNVPVEGKSVIFIEKEPFYIDFYIQTLCQHNIMANSTFSWWSAWLNQNPNKIVVRPAKWLGGYPDIGGPEEWIKIEARGWKEKMLSKGS